MARQLVRGESPDLYAPVVTDGLSVLAHSPELKRRRTTSHYIADSLRTAIHSGSLADGAVLNQVAIAQRFGVSRVPVREAVRQLQAEGLISAEAHRRAVVRGLTIERVVEIFDLRALIEPYLMELALPEIDQATLKRLRKIEAAMSGASHHAEWLRLNSRLHLALYEPSGAVMALELVEQMLARSGRYLNIWSGGHGMDRSIEAGREHRRILERVASKDVEGAQREVREHVARSRQRVIELYGRHSDSQLAQLPTGRTRT